VTKGAENPGEDPGLTAHEAPFVSICVVTGARPKALGALLASLQEQVDAPPFEVLVCGTADPEVAGQVRAYFPQAQVGLASTVRLGGARNFLLPAARGLWLYFLDDDVTIGRHVLRSLAELSSRHPDVGVFGGPNDTPPGSSRFQNTQGASLGSLAGSGPVRRRYTAHRSALARERDLILCNLAVKRQAMVPFDASLTGGEENGLLSQLAKSGVAMRYEPRLVVYHDRRPDLRSFTKQMHKYGFGRGQVLVRRVRSARSLYLLPVSLVVYLVLLPVLAWLSLWALVPLGVYFAWITGGALKVALGYPRARTTAFAMSFLLLPVIHIAYGTGVLRGLVRRPPAPLSQFRWLDDPITGSGETATPGNNLTAAID
jgi:succinoglycan biosynthesis protein ExoA